MERKLYAGMTGVSKPMWIKKEHKFQEKQMTGL